jgi:glycosyltransferase involved in cell wall biosynthesis
VASSSDLYDRCKFVNKNAYFVQHGVDQKHFAGALSRDGRHRPQDLPAGKVVGFFGLLSEWIDQSLLVRLAHDLPQVSIVLIGKSDVDITRLRSQSNIHLLGTKSFAELPAYVACFDVGIIPFVVNELTRAVSPIKLKEMLAAGCPVVSTALPEVEKCQRLSSLAATNHSEAQQSDGEAVAIAGNADEFISLVERRLEHPLPFSQKLRLSEKMKDESWEKKVKEILHLVESEVDK